MEPVAERRCSRCEEHKPIDQFSFKNREKGWRHSHCKSCRRDYHREHYLKNRDHYIARSQEYKRGQRPHQVWNQRARPFS